MSAEVQFFVFALCALAFFAFRLLLGNSSGAQFADEWKPAGNFSTLAVFNRFLLTINASVSAPLALVAVVLLSLVVLLALVEIAPGLALVASMLAMMFFLVVVRLIRDFCAWQAKRFEERLVECIDIMIAALMSGENALQALEAVARSTEGRISREFDEVVRRLRLGLEVEQALGRLLNAYDSEGVRLFGQALLAKWHVGGDLTQVLTSTNRIIRERIKLRMRMDGQLSGVRHAALFVACMPHFVYGFFLQFQPQWVAAIHANLMGARLIYAALALQVLGLFWLSRTLRSDA